MLDAQDNLGPLLLALGCLAGVIGGSAFVWFTAQSAARQAAGDAKVKMLTAFTDQLAAQQQVLLALVEAWNQDQTRPDGVSVAVNYGIALSAANVLKEYGVDTPAVVAPFGEEQLPG